MAVGEIALPAAGAVSAGEIIGDLVLPEGADALVVFAHGSGSSRHSARNRAVAGELQEAGLGTLLMDLLTPGEDDVDERTGQYRFDIGLLTRRVVGVLDWVAARDSTRGLATGVFGASTGAAAALGAAVLRPDHVRAVVSRGGRTDLTTEPLSAVRAPTLLLVGERDERVLQWNRETAAQLTAPHRLHIVRGATHLFPEQGALKEVATTARDWFREHLAGVSAQ